MNAASWLEGLPPGDRARAILMRDGPRIATWVLGIALGVQGAFIVPDLAGGGRAPAASASRGTAAAHPLDITAITRANLFDKAAIETCAGADCGTHGTDTRLVLTGVIAGNDPKNGLAILGQSAQTAKVYAVGDRVPSGAKLHAVYNDHVVVERDGQLLSVALPRTLNAGNAPPPSAAALPGGDNPAIERMRRMISEQPGLIGDVLRPQAVVNHGRTEGFRVYPGRNRAAFQRLGLRPGDEVTAINGTPLDDQDRGEQILRTLGSASEARVTVKRGGQQQDLTLNIAQVAQEADGVGAQAPPPPQPQGLNAVPPAIDQPTVNGIDPSNGESQ
jgi:general secretion pathway protein C